MSEFETRGAENLSRRYFLVSASASLVGLALGAKITGQQPSTKVYEFTNGEWFDGQAFKNRRFYSVGGVLISRKPATRVDSVIDLTGKYVVPPFSEAHNHNLVWNGEQQFAALKRKYLTDGIFYIKNPTNLPRGATSLQGKINMPTSIDAVFSNGGLTGSGGHPIEIVKWNIQRGGMTEADGEGEFYWVIDTADDLKTKWDGILAGKPDFIKTTLVYSEEYEKRRGDDAYFGKKGLNPALLPEIVRRAHAAGLRVTCHIESAADFHNALVAGVDEIAHMSGFAADEKLGLARYEISEADARLAARNRVTVVTTLGEAVDGIYGKGETILEGRKALYDMLVHNLRLLKKHGVSIAVGSDQYQETSLPEALKLHKLKFFDNAELLKMWCETTASAIFPKRRIGRLKDGYEASFLVLGGNPVQDFTNLQRIEMRFKQGEFLSA